MAEKLGKKIKINFFCHDPKLGRLTLRYNSLYKTYYSAQSITKIDPINPYPKIKLPLTISKNSFHVFNLFHFLILSK
jgi:hypothetical protein